MTIKWTKTDEYLMGNNGAVFDKDSLIASFDIDFTILRPKSGKKFPIDENDWMFMNGEVINKFADLAKQNYKFVFVTNQRGLKTDADRTGWMKKLDDVVKQLGIQVLVLCSLENDMYRKPKTNLFNKFVGGYSKDSFFCGDAGGLKGDFDDTDLKFALNLGIKFIHAREFLDGEKLKVPIPEHIKYSKGTYTQFVPQHPEMIIMVGLPGSGKSYYATNYICNDNNYEYINRDTLKTSDKCLKACKAALKAGKSVVIDNTNPDKATRKKYTDIAKEHSVPYRCVYFTTNRDLAKHNAIYRNIMTKNKVEVIPDMAYNIYKKNFQEPSVDESFGEVIKVDFLLDEKKADPVYCQYLE
jgi:bifunctional polynucleotide phosphatase/kinase